MRLIIFALLASVASLAQASVVSYTFNGQLNVGNLASLPGQSLQDGDAYTAIIVADRNNSTGEYTVLSSTLTIDGYAPAELQNPYINQNNNLACPFDDPYCANDYDELRLGGNFTPYDPATPQIDSNYVKFFEIILTDLDSTVLAAPEDLGLQTDFVLSDFEDSFLFIQLSSGYAPGSYSRNVGGSVDSLSISTVPVPAAVWLFGSALAGLGWMRRRQTV